MSAKLLLLSVFSLLGAALLDEAQAVRPHQARHLAAEQCSYGIRDFGRDFLNAASFTAGNVDACNTNPNGSFNISCEEVQKADREAFNSHYDYTLDSNNSSFINCSRINAPEILERLQLQDMAKATADALNCNMAFLNVFDKQPITAEVARLKSSALEAFRMIRQDLQKNLTEKSYAVSDMAMQRSVCHREPGDGGILPLNCTSEEALRTEQHRLTIVGSANGIIDTLVATVPYGTEVEVRQAILSSANADDGAFMNAYSAAIIAVRSRLKEFQARLEATRHDVVTDDGSKVAVYLNDDQCNTPYMISTFFASDQYNTLVNSRHMDPRLKQIMTCRRDSRKIGASRVQTGLMVASVATIGITGGASAAGLTIGAAARTAMVVSDLALSGVGLVVGIPQIYENCYNKGSAVVRGGEKCSPTEGLNMAMTRTSNAMCALSVFSTATSGAYIASGPVMMAIKARRAAVPEEVSAPPAAEIEPVPVNENEIVVIGQRRHKKH